MYLYIHIALSRSSQAAAAVTNAVVTSASKGSGNPLCRREIGRKKLAVHKRSGSHGWIPRWQYSERLPGVPFLKDLFLSPSRSLSHFYSLFLLFFLARSFMPRFASPSLFFLLRPFSSEGTATLSSTTVKALVRGWGRTRENKLPSKFYWSFIRWSLYTSRSFFFDFFQWILSLFTATLYNIFIAFNKYKYQKLNVSIRKTFSRDL